MKEQRRRGVTGKVASFILALCFLLSFTAVASGEQSPLAPSVSTELTTNHLPPATPPPSTLRALLIACDDFVTLPDTTPSSYNNAVALRRALLRDSRGYEAIRVSLNEALDAKSFAELAQETFGEAKDGDVSLLYLSTHGLKMPESPEFIALMSDGEAEAFLSGEDIRAALGGVPGTKIVILDACFSGAAIRKGLDFPLATSPYAGRDFKVLTSAGGMEPSFLWTDGAGKVRGGSYFAQALSFGLTPLGAASADANRDGQVTLAELHGFQSGNYGASSPQAYPVGDHFPVFQYDIGLPPQAPPTISGLVVEPRAITRPNDEIEVSYTLHERARLAYQLVYQRGGQWRFTAPQSISEDGVLPPGRRVARLKLQERMEGLSGYVLLFIVSVVEDRAEPLACVLLTVNEGAGDPALRLDAAPSFTPDAGEEAAFILRHREPVIITATVRDERGNAVARLMTGEPSRPMHLLEEGTPITWNGKLSNGEIAPPGRYYLSVTATVGDTSYTIDSSQIDLLPCPDITRPQQP